MAENSRKFLKYLTNFGIAGFAISIFYPLFQYMQPPKQREVEVSNVSAGKIDEFPEDTGKILQFGNKPVIVIKTENGEFRAFEATCTHLDCTVQYRKDMGIIWCACHNGKYNLSGKNIAGPPPRPLEQYKTIVKDNELIISKKNT